MGILVFVNWLGKSLAKVWRGITFSPAPVSTLHQRLALFFDATGISTIAKVSVIVSMEMPVRVICFGSSSLFWLASQACIMTSSKAGSPSETPTSSALFLPPWQCWVCDLDFLWASLALLDFLHLCFHWPIFWQEWHVESFAGQCSLLGVWHFVQLSHGGCVLMISSSSSVLH